MEKKVYYTIHFEDDGTGEYSDDFVFDTPEEAHNHWDYDYPGYGCMYIKEIDRDEALKILTKEIDWKVNRWRHGDGTGIDPESIESKDMWDVEAYTYIENKEPGWQLLREYVTSKEYEEEMKRLHEEEDAKYIESLKNSMNNAWSEYDRRMKNGEDAELDDDFFEAQYELNELGIEYDPTK